AQLLDGFTASPRAALARPQRHRSQGPGMLSLERSDKPSLPRHYRRARGVAVDCKAYHEWRLRQKVCIPPDPYYWCLQRMIQPLILSIYEVPKDEGFAIYVDRDN